MILPAILLVAQTVASVPRQVLVRNDLPFARASETVEVPLSGDLTRIHVFRDGKEVLAQALSDRLIFQTDIPANATQTFELQIGDKRKYKKEDFRVYGRFVRERADDFAWENDRIAHRMYGEALETWQQEPLTSSAVDVWLKRTRRLAINDWYMVDDYHHDHGEGGDFYSAGNSRGCGGIGLWRDGQLIVSKNFRNSRVIAAGPIRLIFELDYPGFETKRVTLDAGQNFDRFESRLEDANATYAIGVKHFPKDEMSANREAGTFRTWGPVVGAAGHYTCTVMLDPKSIVDVTEDGGNHLVIAHQPAVYWVGTAWDQSGDFPTVADWDRYVDQWRQRIQSPLHVEVK